MYVPKYINILCENIVKTMESKNYNVSFDGPRLNFSPDIYTTSFSCLLHDHLFVNIEWDEIKCCITFENIRPNDRNIIFEVHRYNNGYDYDFVYIVSIKKYGFFPHPLHNCNNFSDLFKEFDSRLISFKTECIGNIDFYELQKILIPDDTNLNLLDFSFLFSPNKKYIKSAKKIIL